MLEEEALSDAAARGPLAEPLALVPLATGPLEFQVCRRKRSGHEAMSRHEEQDTQDPWHLQMGRLQIGTVALWCAVYYIIYQSRNLNLLVLLLLVNSLKSSLEGKGH